MTCNIGGGFVNGFDPHTVTSYQSPNGGHAFAVLRNDTATTLAVVDLTLMLNPVIVPRTVGAAMHVWRALFLGRSHGSGQVC